MAMSLVSLCAESMPHVLVSFPAVVQVAGVVTDHAPHLWTWAGSGSAGVSQAINASANDRHTVNTENILSFFPIYTSI